MKCCVVIGPLYHWWDCYCLIWIQRPLKFLEGMMNVLFKCIPSYDRGPAMRRVWAVLCSVDVKTSRNAEDFMSNLFLPEFGTNEYEVLSLFLSVCACAIIRRFFYCLQQAVHKKHFIRFWNNYHEHNCLNRSLFIYGAPLGYCWPSLQLTTSVILCDLSKWMNLMSAI